LPCLPFHFADIFSFSIAVSAVLLLDVFNYCTYRKAEITGCGIQQSEPEIGQLIRQNVNLQLAKAILLLEN